MSWTVEWNTTAENQLARIWLDSRIRNEVTAAARAIDRRLEADPENTGESRPDGRRIVLIYPLGAIFKVDRSKREVVVGAVWSYSKRPRNP
jgi:hypothetical protein